ncbi:head-tail connector protein [Primorskyibacter aestuariivivens]|uniref:head-tail connector protein n=1 Tax=Primorskyibacter aestuariivivens TaxID=1888912 RepID=UPI002300BBC1|nr:head-tail connector protein [Primorskyibacter aestuariivivens]MDA7429827.1 head-tail connector protein [Primorskyibacter aestuariivivens]
MMLVEETTVPGAALPVEAFKAHLRLGAGFSGATVQDAVLESFLRAAIAAIEARTGKVLIARDFSWTVSQWRAANLQPLPVAPVSAVGTVEIEDAGGTVNVADPGAYRLVAETHVPKLRATGACLPGIPARGSAKVTFTAGYSADWGALPADLGQAVMLLAAHYYEYRDETALGQGCMPFGVTSLIERYRVMRAGFGVVQ